MSNNISSHDNNYNDFHYLLNEISKELATDGVACMLLCMFNNYEFNQDKKINELMSQVKQCLGNTGSQPNDEEIIKIVIRIMTLGLGQIHNESKKIPLDAKTLLDSELRLSDFAIDLRPVVDNLHHVLVHDPA